MKIKEFKVNKFITVRLEHSETNIYVDGEFFIQCKFLLLNIPIDNISSFDDIESIDEAAENLDRSMEGNEREKLGIPSKVEFWGHSSVRHEVIMVHFLGGVVKIWMDLNIIY